jgi:hypothetical protein
MHPLKSPKLFLQRETDTTYQLHDIMSKFLTTLDLYEAGAPFGFMDQSFVAIDDCTMLHDAFMLEDEEKQRWSTRL